jgi:hypothetical protein
MVQRFFLASLQPNCHHEQQQTGVSNHFVHYRSSVGYLPVFLILQDTKSKRKSKPPEQQSRFFPGQTFAFIAAWRDGFCNFWIGSRTVAWLFGKTIVFDLVVSRDRARQQRGKKEAGQRLAGPYRFRVFS